MSARILVVDDVPANVKLLEARLSAEYFDVLTAASTSIFSNQSTTNTATTPATTCCASSR